MASMIMKQAKEGDPIPGGYALTELGATALNGKRKSVVAGLRATVLEKIAYTCRETEPKTAHVLMEMNAKDLQEIFGGQRKNLQYNEIGRLKNQEKDDLLIATLESKLSSGGATKPRV